MLSFGTGIFSLGNYITDDKYKVDYEEVTIDHAGMYDFKISGLNNMLQNAKDFLILFLDTDMGLNTNMQCRDLELYMHTVTETSFEELFFRLHPN